MRCMTSLMCFWSWFRDIKSRLAVLVEANVGVAAFLDDTFKVLGTRSMMPFHVLFFKSQCLNLRLIAGHLLSMSSLTVSSQSLMCSLSWHSCEQAHILNNT